MKLDYINPPRFIRNFDNFVITALFLFGVVAIGLLGVLIFR